MLKYGDTVLDFNKIYVEGISMKNVTIHKLRIYNRVYATIVKPTATKGDKIFESNNPLEENKKVLPVSFWKHHLEFNMNGHARNKI